MFQTVKSHKVKLQHCPKQPLASETWEVPVLWTEKAKRSFFSSLPHQPPTVRVNLKQNFVIQVSDLRIKHYSLHHPAFITLQQTWKKKANTPEQSVSDTLSRNPHYRGIFRLKTKCTTEPPGAISRAS